jgi:hypothetical protein
VPPRFTINCDLYRDTSIRYGREDIKRRLSGTHYRLFRKTPEMLWAIQFAARFDLPLNRDRIQQ